MSTASPGFATICAPRSVIEPRFSIAVVVLAVTVESSIAASADGPLKNATSLSVRTQSRSTACPVLKMPPRPRRTVTPSSRSVPSMLTARRRKAGATAARSMIVVAAPAPTIATSLTT